MTTNEIRNREVREPVTTLAMILRDQKFSPAFADLRERMAKESDSARREQLSDQLLDVVSRWTAMVADVTADLYAVAARQPCRIVEVPKDEPPDRPDAA